jgi:hypothetical protein
MIDRDRRCSRRKFLASAAAAVTLAQGSNPAQEPANMRSTAFRARPPRPGNDGRKPIACVTTVYRPMSHSFHIAGRFFDGYAKGGELHVPQQYLRGMAVDQTPENDLSRDMAREFGCRWSRSIADVLFEGDKLAVEGVLLIAEHGNYPRNEKGQILYPRYEMFQQIVEAFRKAGRTVPVFCDKHLSYSWAKAKQMYDWARELKFPLMAGSSLPVTWRRPELELPLNAPVEEALVAGYGPIEVYGFHALETLQCMLERRNGGETGVRAVTCLSGREVWKAGDAGKWSWGLLEHALGRSESLCPGDIRRNVGNASGQGMPASPAIAFLIEYRDGTRGTAMLLNGHIQDFCFAARLTGETPPPSCMFLLPPPPGAKFFDGLVMNIEKLFETGHSPYPVERTLLTSGLLDALLTSHLRRGERIETPELEIRYATPAESGFIRGSVSAPVA